MRKHTHYHTKFSWVQGCWLVNTLILFIGGVYALGSHEQTLLTIAKPLGAAMLTAGIINMFVCDRKSHVLHGSRWLFADGMTAICLSLFPLFNQMILPVMIPFFFGVWELISGILKVMDSSELKEDKIECWPGFALIGFLELLSGAASMIEPIDDFVGIGRVIAIIFFVQSLSFALKATMYKYLIK